MSNNINNIKKKINNLNVNKSVSLTTNNVANIKKKINTLNVNKSVTPPPPQQRVTLPKKVTPPPPQQRVTLPKKVTPPPPQQRVTLPKKVTPPPPQQRVTLPKKVTTTDSSNKTNYVVPESPPPSYSNSNNTRVKKTLNKMKNLSSDVFLKLKNSAKKLHGVSKSKTVNKIIRLAVGIMFLLSLVILSLFYKTLNKHFKNSIIYLIYSLLTLMVSLFVIPMIFSDSSTIGQIATLVIIGIATLFFAVFTKKYIEYLKSFRKDSPYLIKDMKNAKKSLVIEQNPDNDENIILYRSDNEDGGIEFSYSFWILVNDFTFKDKNMKHVFHKGDSKAEVSYTPAVWIHPDKNTIRINMNTIDSKDNIIDIDNMPVNKWVHLSLVVKQKVVTIYVNGNIKKSKRLESIPRQNFGNVWINLFGGFDGYLSKLKYTRRALSYSEVENMVSDGPSTKMSESSGVEPPYLDDDWWLK